MKSVYSILNKDAKDWWYHEALRRQGNVEEARMRERDSIKRAVRNIRKAVLFRVGLGGFSMKLNDNSTLSHCSSGDQYAEILRRCRPEVPSISTVKATNLLTLCGLPMAAVHNKPDDPYPSGAYSSMHYAPLGIVLACYEELGAEVHWGDLNPEEWREKAVPTIARVRGKEAA